MLEERGVEEEVLGEVVVSVELVMLAEGAQVLEGRLRNPVVEVVFQQEAPEEEPEGFDKSRNEIRNLTALLPYVPQRRHSQPSIPRSLDTTGS